MKARTDDSVHNRHGGIEQVELTRQAWLSEGTCDSRWKFNHGVSLPPEPGISVLMFIEGIRQTLVISREYLTLRAKLTLHFIYNLG
jgi:hypothetical protein